MTTRADGAAMAPIISGTVMIGGRPGRIAAAAAWIGGALFVASLGYFLYSYLVRFGTTPSGGSAARAAGIDVLLFTGFALHHSLFARMRLKTLVTRLAGPALERSVFTWTASLLFLAVCAWWQPVPGLVYRLDGPVRWLGYAVQAAGVLFTYFGSRALDVLDLAGIRHVQRARRGVSPGRPPLVTSGVFAIVRHPLYFGWALLVFGAPTMTATRLVFAVVSTLYLALAIPLEERSLAASFGAEYAEYGARVRWRMLPGLY
jgi:protein-S-isoprenylcysteine O-methyltransferase Ste14